MVFYMDVFGRKERFDSQAYNCRQNHRYRIPADYLSEYYKTAENGFGYSPMDAYATIFEMRGLNRTESALYEKIVKFRNILREKVGTVISENKPLVSETNIKKSGFKGFLGFGIFAAALITGVIISADRSLRNMKNKNHK